MKTKKVMVYGLISLFVFLPFLNLESLGATRTAQVKYLAPRMEPAPADVIIPVCYQWGDQICCEDFICYGDDLSNCDILPTGPRCYPSTPAK
jgi:hypothetical protein